MSDALLERLAQAACNRGLKLIRSRVRTPGKGRFGKVGLTDASGKALFGMDNDGPIASSDEVEAYLRDLEAKDWGKSVKIKAPARSKQSKTKSNRPSTIPQAVNEHKASARHELQVRDARPSDVPKLVELIRELGAKIDEAHVRSNLASLRKSGETPLVATLGGEVVGLCGLGRRIAVHRPAPLGRITVLVVKREVQGKGIGRHLVEAAERWMKKCGCYLVEVTSNDRRTAAHAFYRHLGYQGTSIRFAKNL